MAETDLPSSSDLQIEIDEHSILGDGEIYDLSVDNSSDSCRISDQTSEFSALERGKRVFHDFSSDDGDDLALTPFDIHRKPRAQKSEGENVHLDSDIVHNELKCPICLGVLKHTVTVMECMHRFCSSCIQKCLRVTRKECPSCRIHVPSRRSLRPDPGFDAIIAVFYPDLENYEHQQDLLAAEHAKQQPPFRKKFKIEQQQRKPAVNYYTTKSSRSQRRQSSQESKPQPPVEKPPIQEPEHSQPNVSKTQSLWHGHRTVEFVLRKHPRETSLSSLPEEYFRTVSHAQIQHVKEVARHILHTSVNLELIMALDHANITLADDVTLEEIVDNLGEGKPHGYLLVLYFRTAPSNI